MAQKGNINVNGLSIPVWAMQSTAQQIDNATQRVIATPGTGAITAVDVGAAPVGFGLGGGSSPNYYNLPDEIKANGFFRTNVLHNMLGSIFSGWAFGYHLEDVVDGTNTYPAYQLFINQNGYYLVQRFRRNGVWFDFQWINPPMQLGVEYLTTEVYNGSSVYAKAVNFGSLPNNTQASVAHGIQNIQNCIYVGGTIGTYNLLGFSGVADVFCGVSSIAIKTSENLSSYSAVVILKYTKTTA